MPWRTLTVEEARAELIADYETGAFKISELARMHGVSRQWVYEILRRHEDDPASACLSRSRRPLHSPGATAEAIVELMFEFHRKHPSLSPRKVVERLTQLHPSLKFPAASVAYTIFDKAGLSASERRIRRQRPAHPGRPILTDVAPGEVVTADFKGQFKTLDGIYTYPFTAADLASRRLHAVDAYSSTKLTGVVRSLSRVFAEVGKPLFFLSDNGSPFAASGPGRISRLRVWLMQHSIQPLTIAPGHPEQNGVHERMHRTLKCATALPPASNKRQQQRRFDVFKHEFNDDRPHDALGKKTPGSVFVPSPRKFEARIAPFDYRSHLETRRVSASGSFKWRGQAVFLSDVLAGEWIALEEVEYGVWIIWFRQFEIARFNESTALVYA